MGRRISLQLNDVEDGNINGWVNWLRANPQYIGVYGRAPQPVLPPGFQITWQTRIVLEDQTRARFEELAAQFPVYGTPPPPPPPPVVVDPRIPTEIDMRDEFTRETRGDPNHPDQNVLVVQMWRTLVLVIPFRIPLPPYPTNQLNFGPSICEYGSPPTFRQSTVSRTPGDFSMTSPTVVWSEGLTPNYTLFVGQGYTPGELLYANFRFWAPWMNDGEGGCPIQENQLDMAQQSRFSMQWPH